MQTDIHKIYQQTISPLPEKEQLLLASLILEEGTGKTISKTLNTKNKAEIAEMYGWWQGKQITYEDYLKLDHNERIDFDLARAYADNHEGED